MSRFFFNLIEFLEAELAKIITIWKTQEKTVNYLLMKKGVFW